MTIPRSVFLDTLLQAIDAAPDEKRVVKITFTWTAGGNVETIKAHDKHDNLLYTLTFAYNVEDNLESITRS